MIEITKRGHLGFHQYGDPVQLADGFAVEIYESSAAMGPHCWLRVFDELGNDRTAHIDLVHAVALLDLLYMAASSSCCWLDVRDDGSVMIMGQRGFTTAVRLTSEQTSAIHDRLKAFVDEVPTRWNMP